LCRDYSSIVEQLPMTFTSLQLEGRLATPSVERIDQQSVLIVYSTDVKGT